MTTKTYDTIDPKDFPDLTKQKGQKGVQQKELNPDDFPDLKKKGGTDSVKSGGGLDVPLEIGSGEGILLPKQTPGMFDAEKILGLNAPRLTPAQEKLRRDKETFDINNFNTRVYAGAVSPIQLDVAYQNSFGKPIVDKLINEYAPDLVGGNWGKTSQNWDELSKRIKTKNRGNAKNDYDGFLANADIELANAAETYKLERNTFGGGTGGGMVSTTTFAFPKVDPNDPQGYRNAMDKIMEASRVVDANGETIQGGKERFLNLLYQKAKDDVSKTGVSKEVELLSAKITRAIARSNINREIGKNVPLDEFASHDKQNEEHFKLGLSLWQKTDPARFKNIIAVINDDKQLVDDDFRQTAEAGQDLSNQQIFFGAATNPELIDKETNLDYTTRSDELNMYSIIAGERLKAKGEKPFFGKYSEQQIRSVLADMPNKSVVTELANNEKLNNEDAIPKYGTLAAFKRGSNVPFEGIISSIQAFEESPVETYIRSKTPNVGNQALPSEKNNVWINAVEGLGQFASQVVLTEATGGALAGASGVGRVLGAAAARNTAVYGGTLISTALQTYGDSYADYLQKTGGDVATSKLAATIDSAVSGLAEFMLPDVKIADRAFKGLRGKLVEDIIDFAKKGGDPAMLAAKGRPFIEKFVKEYIDISRQEISEEVVTQVVDILTESIFSPRTAESRDMGAEVVETIKQTAVQMALPSLFGATGVGLNQDFSKKIFNDAAVKLPSYKQTLDRALNAGEIDQKSYNNVISLLATHNESITNAPTEDITGRKLTDKQQLDYAFEQTKIKYYEDKASKQTGEAKAMYEDKAKQAQDIQKQILRPDELAVQIGEIDDRWKANIIAIANRTDIDDAEKERLKKAEDARHAQEIASINKQKPADNGSKESKESDSKTQNAQGLRPEKSSVSNENDIREKEVLKKEGAGTTTAAAPSLEEQSKDVQDGNVVTFTYDNESQVPEVFKDKISSTGETNGKPFVRVTVAKSLADYELGKAQQESKPATEDVVPSLKDVESTAQALRDIGEKAVIASGAFSETPKSFFEKYRGNKDPAVPIAEAYHEAKKDGSNPDLVKAVEDTLSPKQQTKASPTEQSQKADVVPSFEEEISAQDLVEKTYEIHRDKSDFEDTDDYGGLESTINKYPYYELRDVPIGEIKERSKRFGEERVLAIMDEMRGNKDYPPIILDGDFIIDGVHRYEALKRLGAESIKAYVGVESKSKKNKKSKSEKNKKDPSQQTKASSTVEQTAAELQHTYGNKLPQLLNTVNDFDLFDKMSLDDVGETTGRARRITNELEDDKTGVLDIPAVKTAMKTLFDSITPENLQNAKDVIKAELGKIIGKDQLVQALSEKQQSTSPTVEQTKPATEPAAKPKGRLTAEEFEKNAPVVSKPAVSEPIPNKKGRTTVTLSGNTEKERQQLIKQRKKETYVPTQVQEEQKLREQIESFNKNNSKKGRKSKLGVIEANRLKLAVDAFNKRFTKNYSALQNRQGQILFKNEKGRLIAKSNKLSGDLSIDETGKPLLERGEKVNDVFNRFLEAETFPTGYTVDGRRMSDAQLDGTIQDILDGIPSRAANNYLDALEKMAEKDRYDFSKTGALETQQYEPTLDEATGVTRETIGEPMTQDALEQWLNEQGDLTPDQEQTVVDNIENLITEYEQGFRIVDENIIGQDSGNQGQVQPATGESQTGDNATAEQNQQPEAEPSESGEAAKTRQELNKEKFNEKSYKLEDKTVAFLNKFIKPKTDTGGAQIQGLDLEALVRAGFDAIRKAYSLVQDVDAAIREGVAEMKKIWNANTNDPFPESDLEDHLRQNFTPKKFAAQQQAAQSAATSEDLVISKVLNLSPDPKDFPTVFQNNQVLQQETAETTGDVQNRVVNGQYVQALQTDLQEIAEQSAKVLRNALGPDWAEKTLRWIEQNPKQGDLSQIVAILGIISTENNDAIQNSNNGSEIARLRKIQKRIDVATNTNARIAALALNQRRLLRKFATGNNMVSVLTGAVLTPEIMDLQDELNTIMSEEVSDEEINAAQPTVQQSQQQQPKKQSVIRKVLSKAKGQNTALRDELKTRAAAATNKTGKNVSDIINDVNNKIKNIKC